MSVPIPRPILYALSLLLASEVALTGAALYVSSANTARSDRNTEKALQQWCSTLRVFRETYQQSPPTTPAGRKIRDGLNGIYDAYHCDQIQEPK